MVGLSENGCIAIVDKPKSALHVLSGPRVVDIISYLLLTNTTMGHGNQHSGKDAKIIDTTCLDYIKKNQSAKIRVHILGALVRGGNCMQN